LFDLLLFPIRIESGRELPELPGLWAASAPPRGCARLRSQDLLVLYLSLTGNAPLSPSNQQDLLKKMAELYYQSQGSVTAGLREMVIQLNQVLLDRNMKMTREGGREIGVLNALVVHGEIGYILHAGATSTLSTNQKQVEVFQDEDVPLRGLGLGKAAAPQFYTVSVQPGSLLILSPEPSRQWSRGLLDALPRQPLDQVRRSLLLGAPLDLQAVVIKLQEGKGQVRLLRPKIGGVSGDIPDEMFANTPGKAPGELAGSKKTTSASSEPELPARLSNPSSPAPPAKKPAGVYLGKDQISPVQPGMDSTRPLPIPQKEKDAANRKRAWAGLSSSLAKASDWLSQPAFGQPEVPSKPSSIAATAQDSSQPLAEKALENLKKSDVPAAATERVHSAPVSEPLPVQKPERKLPRWMGPVIKGFDAFGKTTRAGLSWLGSGISTLIERSLPESTPGFSTALMTFIAIAVPVAVVAVATTFYLQSGRGQQHAAYYQQAEQMAELTSKQQDINARRSGWQQVLAVLDKADSYGTSDSSRALRRQAQTELDNIEGVTRIPFLPAFPDRLDSSVSITRMISNASDVYLLDANQGRVFRLFRTAQGYDLDPKFVCGPVQRAGFGVGKLIDIAPIPVNNDLNPGGPPPALVAMDASANLAYCGAGLSSPITRSLVPPGSGWGKVAGFTVFQNSLYILDTLNSLVWRYNSLDGVSFAGDPILYFGRTIPPLADVIDIGAYQNDLYLLRADGKMVTCTYATPGISTTRCNDPNPYGDNRNGREPSPLVFLDAKFDQIQIVRPPDPSIYILDVSAPSIYHFSLRLNLQKQYRVMSDPDHPLPQTNPTSFVVTAGRQVLLAFGNRVYLSELP